MSKDYRHLEESLLPSKTRGLERELAKAAWEDVVLVPQGSLAPPEHFYLVATLRSGPSEDLVEVRTTAHVVTAKEHATWGMMDVAKALDQRYGQRKCEEEKVAVLRTKWEVICEVDAFPGFVFTWTWERGVVIPWEGQLRRFEERPTYRER